MYKNEKKDNDNGSFLTVMRLDRQRVIIVL